MSPKSLILHIDCNSFYVSCQAAWNPVLRGMAAVVLSSNDGNIIARSPEAKDLGIKMGQPYFQVDHLLNKGKLAVFSSNYELYGDMSTRVMNILRRFVDTVDVYSIDEAFLDTEGYETIYPNYLTLAHQIKDTIYRWTRIPVSIGLAPTMTLAKLANKLAKKDPDLGGICKLDTWGQISSLLQEMPVGDLWGIGRCYAEVLNNFGILSAYQLTQCPDEWIRAHLTIRGLRMIHELRGERRCKLAQLPKKKKRVMVCPSFGRNVEDLATMEEALTTHINRACEKVRRQNLGANLITVFIHTNRWRVNQPQYHNSQTIALPYPTNSAAEMATYAVEVLRNLYRQGFTYRKVGIMLSGLQRLEGYQMKLFVNEPDERRHQVSETVDQINLRYGRDTVRFAAQGFSTHWQAKRQFPTRNPTTRWKHIVQAE